MAWTSLTTLLEGQRGRHGNFSRRLAFGDQPAVQARAGTRGRAVDEQLPAENDGNHVSPR